MRSLQKAIPCVEGKLYEWAMGLTEKPQPIISRPLDGIKADKLGKKLSVQEEWVIRQFSRSIDKRIIEDALKGMSPEQQRLIKYRYIDGLKYTEIADNMNISEAGCYRLRDETLLILAYEFRMLTQEEVEARAL